MTLVLIAILFLSFVVAENDLTTSNRDNDSEDEIKNETNDDGQNHVEVEIENEGDDSELRNTIQLRENFCGTSTLATCEEDEDCVIGGCSQAVCQGASEEPAITTCEFKECYNTTKYDAECKCEDRKCQWDKLTEIRAREKIKEKLSGKFQNETFELNDDGNYEYRAEKKARLFFLFSVKIKVETEVNSETGEIKTKIPWWSFLAKDEEVEDTNEDLSGGTMLAGSESNLTDEELAAA